MSQDQRPARMRVSVSRDTVKVAEQPVEIVPAIAETNNSAAPAAKGLPVLLLLLCALVAGGMVGAALAYFGLFAGGQP